MRVIIAPAALMKQPAAHEASLSLAYGSRRCLAMCTYYVHMSRTSPARDSKPLLSSLAAQS